MTPIEWTDGLPTNWEVKPLRSVACYVVSNVDKKTHEGEIPVRLCNYANVYHSEFITLGMDFMHATATKVEIERFGVRVDDVLITKDSESWDDIGIPALVRQTRDDLVCGYHLAIVRALRDKMMGAFLFRCLQAKPIRVQLELTAAGITRFGVPKSAIGMVRLPAPPLPQQTTISEYLDCETARIDELIAANERLLRSLAEKRQAIVSQAVTRGLDPNVPLRDSGITWLGDIPAHWETVALRFLVDFTSGATPRTGASEFWDGEIPWVSPKDMKRLEIHDAQDHISELALSKGILRPIDPGSVLMVVRGMILAHSLPVAVTTAPVTFNQDMKALRCRGSLVPYFLRDYFRGIEEYIVSLADASAHGTRKLETEVLGRLEIAVPPLQEQRAIVTYIGEATGKVDRVEAAARATISLLTERRSALIAAAVTGQIDVESLT